MPFQQQCNTATCGCRQLLHRLAINAALPCGRLQIAHQYIDGSGLACTVFAQQSQYFACLHLKIKVFVNLSFSIIVCQMATLYNGFTHIVSLEFFVQNYPF